jgi:hypothetical protein
MNGYCRPLNRCNFIQLFEKQALSPMARLSLLIP